MAVRKGDSSIKAPNDQMALPQKTPQAAWGCELVRHAFDPLLFCFHRICHRYGIIWKILSKFVFRGKLLEKRNLENPLDLFELLDL